MKITNRLYSYPVLCADNDDYVSSKFAIDMEVETNSVDKLTLKISIQMNNVDLMNLINHKNKAEYVIHIECGRTAYRRTVRKHEKIFNIDIPYNQVNGNVEIVGFILAKEDLKDFKANDWNEDFNDMTFDIPKASVLAYENLANLFIQKDDEDLNNSESIFRVIKKNTDMDYPVDFELNGDKIVIQLCPTEYDLFNTYAQRVDMRPLVNSLIILPVLVQVFEDIRQEGSENSFASKNWFVSLQNSYKKKNMNLIEELNSSTKSSLVMAQEAMELPIVKAFEAISTFEQSFSFGGEE